VRQDEGRTLEWTPSGPGNYRVEAELKVLRLGSLGLRNRFECFGGPRPEDVKGTETSSGRDGQAGHQEFPINVLYCIARRS